jgi:hypothetical protein
MRELALFSQAVQFIKSQQSISVDPEAFSEDMYWIQYKLLSFPTILRAGSKERDIDNACRMGALLYMKAILEEFPHSATGSSILLRRLQESLDKIPVVEVNARILLWLSLIGAALSKHELQRTWFVVHLALLTTFVPLSSFDDENLPVNRILWLQNTLGRALKELWAEVMVVRQRCVEH